MMKCIITAKNIFLSVLLAVAIGMVSTACSGDLVKPATNNDENIKVTFSANGGSFPDSSVVQIKEIAYGKTVENPDVDPQKEGYIFRGWYFNLEGTSKFSSTTPLATDTIVYALWTNDSQSSDNIAITFLANGGTFSDGTESVITTIPVRTSANNPDVDPQKEGYIFRGWYFDPGGSSEFSSTTPLVADTLVYALWRELTEEEKKQQETSTQTDYAKETDGAPARPTWVDAFRYYQEDEFFKKGRYLLVWRKDPGDTGNYAEKWELHQILFNNPTEMATDEKWGKTIDVQDIKETKVLLVEDNLTQYSHDTATTVDIPNNLLPDDQFSTASSTSSPSFQVVVSDKTQVGYKGITYNDNSRQLVVAYKVRVFRSVIDTDDFGNVINKELYNDSAIMMVNYKQGKFVQITSSGSGNTGGGGGSSNLVPDTITTYDQLRTELSFAPDQNFTLSWENQKVTGTTPLEELITRDDFEKLFPPEVGKLFHDKTNSYYTWENFVEASRYFPKLFNEGTEEDRYRELAAFLGNKSHETGDGWASLGADRWTYGMVWIVELSALSGSGLDQNPGDPEDLYKAYMRDSYYDAGSTYVGPEGKSYHGRGPVQLSWNYNYGAMSLNLFGDSSILLENPNLVAREGIIGYASALWFWMQPQGAKPSAHDVMVGNVDLTEPYTVPTSRENRTVRTHTNHSTGSMADGTVISYKDYSVPAGFEIGFGATINIINGGLEANTGKIDNRHAKRIGYFARYLDYFGTKKNGRTDGLALPISPEVGHRIVQENGADVRIGGDPVPDDTVELMTKWRKWIKLPADYPEKTDPDRFPFEDIPSILSAIWQSSF